MKHGQMTKSLHGQNAAVATNATSALNYDTLGYDHAIVDVIHNAATATNSSAKWTALRLLHGTTTDATNHTAVSNMTGTTEATATTSQFVLPVHNDTTLSQCVRFNVSLHDKERYLRVEKHAAASHATTVNVVRLSEADSVPDTVAERGVGAEVFG